MEQNLATVLIFVTVIIAFTAMFIAILNFRIKRRAIKSGLTDDDALKALSRIHYNFQADPLKWGLLLLSGGAGLVTLNFIHYKTDSTLPYGIELICLSAGFLAYYFISAKHKK